MSYRKRNNHATNNTGKALVLELMEVSASVDKSRNYNLSQCLEKYDSIKNDINMAESGLYVSNAATVYTRKVDMFEEEVIDLLGNINANESVNQPENQPVTVARPTRRRRSTIAQPNQVSGEPRYVNFIPQNFEVVPKSTIMESYKKWDKNSCNDINKNDTKRSQRKKVPKTYHRINLIQNNNRVHLENGNLEIIDDKGHVHHRQNYNVFMKYIDDMDNSIKTEQEYYKSLKFIQSQQESNANKNDDNISTDRRKDTINTRLTVKPFRTFLSISEMYEKCNLVISKTEYGNLMKYNAKINELLLLSDDELLKYEYGNEINNIMFENNSETYEIDEIANSVNNFEPDVTLNTVKQVNNSTEIIEPANSVDNIAPDVTQKTPETVKEVNNTPETVIEVNKTPETVEEVNNTPETVEEVNNTPETIEPANIVDSVATNRIIETVEQVQNTVETIEPTNTVENVAMNKMIDTDEQVQNTVEIVEPTNTVDCVQRDIMDETFEQAQNTVETIEPTNTVDCVQRKIMDEQVQNTVETIEPVNSIEAIDSVNTTEAIEPLTTIQTVALVHNVAGNIEPVCRSKTISNTKNNNATNSTNNNNQLVNIISNNNLISNVDNKINRANKKKREPDGNSQDNAIKRSRYNTDNINILDTIKISHIKSDICIVSLPITVYLSEFELVDWLNVSPLVLICNHSSNKNNMVNRRNCVVKFCAEDKLNIIQNDFLGVYSNMNRRIVFSLPKEYDELKLARIENCSDSDETMSQDEIEMEFSGFENVTVFNDNNNNNSEQTINFTNSNIGHSLYVPSLNITTGLMRSLEASQNMTETITFENCTTNTTSVCENPENNTPTIISTTDFQENAELNNSTVVNNTTISNDNLENTELNDSTIENNTTISNDNVENTELNDSTIVNNTTISNDNVENTELNDSTIENNTTISNDNVENTELNDSTIVNNTTMSTDNLENTELNESTIVNNTTMSTDNLENTELNDSTIVNNTTMSTDNLENTELNDSTIVNNTTMSTDNLENTELNDSTIVNNTTMSTDNLENTELNDTTIVNNTTMSTDNLENTELNNSTIVSNNNASIASDNLENTGIDNSTMELVENNTTITTDSLENTELDNSAVESGENREQTDNNALSTDLTNANENISSNKDINRRGRALYDYFSQFSFINNNLNVYEGAKDSASNVNEIAKLLLKDLSKQKSQKFNFHDFVMKHSDVSLPMCFFALLVLINTKNVTIIRLNDADNRSSLENIIITLINSEFNEPDIDVGN